MTDNFSDALLAEQRARFEGKTLQEIVSDVRTDPILRGMLTTSEPANVVDWTKWCNSSVFHVDGTFGGYVHEAKTNAGSSIERRACRLDEERTRTTIWVTGLRNGPIGWANGQSDDLVGEYGDRTFAELMARMVTRFMEQKAIDSHRTTLRAEL